MNALAEYGGWIAYDEQHLIWGCGPSHMSALADAKDFLPDGADLSELKTCPATERLLEAIERGRLGWNLDTRLADLPEED